MPTDEALLVRAAACRELVADGQLDGEIGLSFVIWPTEQLEQASASVKLRRVGKHPWFHPEEQARALELVAAGLSAREAGERIGAAKQTVLGWVRADRRVSETGN